MVSRTPAGVLPCGGGVPGVFAALDPRLISVVPPGHDSGDVADAAHAPDANAANAPDDDAADGLDEEKKIVMRVRRLPRDQR